MFRVESLDAKGVERWAAALAALCHAGDCITLAGPLGVGKTTFARGFIRQLAGEVEITSPTFTLVNSYDSAPPVYHADLYRLKSAAELVELGLDEALAAGILLVEWPEIAGDMLPENRLSLRLEVPPDDPQTRILIGNPPVTWYSRLKGERLIT